MVTADKSCLTDFPSSRVESSKTILETEAVLQEALEKRVLSFNLLTWCSEGCCTLYFPSCSADDFNLEVLMFGCSASVSPSDTTHLAQVSSLPVSC